MASIYKRNGKYKLVYSYQDKFGKKHQKWETFNTQADANKRRKQVEYELSTGKQVVVSSITLNEFLNEYIKIYGAHKWAPSTYKSNTALIETYIRPIIGEMKMDKFNVKTIEEYYLSLLSFRREYSSRSRNAGRLHACVQPATITSIHKVLSSVFNQAIKWGYMNDNPCRLADRPKYRPQKRDIWDAETIFRAIELCDDPILKLAINLAFACSLRIGELLGLTWDCVHISEKEIKQGRASIRVEKEIQRLNAEALANVGEGDIIKIFPSYVNNSKKTKLVLKTPKTESSNRTIYLPISVANMLVKRHNEIINNRKILGDEYIDHNLVFCYPNGIPMEESCIRRGFNKLIEENDLPKVVFHSLRHSSITYKLKLTGDIKAVQGDSGHSQIEMITDVYAHILDESRVQNAQMFETQFYGGKAPEEMVEKAKISIIEPTKSMTEEEMLVKQITENPEALALMKKILAKSSDQEVSKSEAK